MTVLEFRAAPARMETNSDVQVVLFTHDGTTEIFALEGALSNYGHVPLESYEDKPVRNEPTEC